MKKRLLLVVFILSSSLNFAQPDSCEYYPAAPYPLFSVATPYIPHASNISGKEGNSLTYSYPGFFSDYGQINFYHTNASGNSFYAGIGSTYILLGCNIGTDLSEKSIVFLNLNVGTRYPPGGDNAYRIENSNNFFYSLGFSYLYKLSLKNRMEISLDIYKHPNRVKERMLPPTTNLHDTELARGIVLGIFINHSFTDFFMINFGTGISYIQYYTECEEHLEDGQNLYNQKWDSSIIIPLGITLSYHF